MVREYMDEKILRINNDLEEEKAEIIRRQTIAQEIAAQDIEGGQATVYGKPITFVPREFLDGQLQLYMPNDWTNLSPEMAKIKYPQENRPPLIISDSTTAINLTINYIATQLNSEDINPFADRTKNTINKLFKAQFLEEGLVENKESGIVAKWYDFISPGIDENLYNLVVCTSLEKRALLLTFNCFAKQQERWKPIFNAMMNTLTLKSAGQYYNRRGGR